MKIPLNTINSAPIDLAICPEFVEYYNTGNSFTKHIIDKEINNGHYNDEQFQKIFKEKNAVVIDAGANIGLFSLHLFPSCSKIHAIEPTGKHLNVLRKLAELHNITNIEYHELALNNYNGHCNFMIDHGNTTQNRIDSSGNDKIPCFTVKSFIENLNLDKIDLLKLDIEGGEQEVVMNDPSFISLRDICDNIYIEIHPPFVNPMNIIHKFTIEMGYKVKYMNSEYLNNNLNILAYR
jgi:FkbM family methyltransferase